jgi:hypothetical protein
MNQSPIKSQQPLTHTIMRNVKEIQAEANNHLSKLQRLVEDNLKHDGDKSASSQRILILNEINTVEYAFNGIEQSDLTERAARETDGKREELRQLIYADEGMYDEAVKWMEDKALEEGNHTYDEGGKVWHKNATELIEEGYLDKHIDSLLS